MNFTVKRLSEYNAIEGMQILNRLNRAAAPYAKDKKLMGKLKSEFAKYDATNPGESRVLVFMGILDFITNSAPELIFEIVAVMCDVDKKEIAQANALDVVDAILLLKDDVKLMDFLSKRFSLGQSE